MKRLILLLDALNDQPQAGLQGRTPLEVACTPALDGIAQRGRVGVLGPPPVWGDARFEFVYLNGLGLPPRRNLPSAGPLSALGSDLALEVDDHVYCASFVTVWEDLVADPFTVGLTGHERDALIRDLNRELTEYGAELRSGPAGEMYLVVHDSTLHAPPTLSPYYAVGEALINVVPQGPASTRILDIMDCSMRFLAGHDVNRVRQDLGENPAHLLWPWGGGLPIRYPVEEEAQVPRIVIGSDSLFLGVGRYLGWETRRTEAKVGDREAGWRALLRAMDRALLRHDIVAVHSGALLQTSLMGTVEDRLAAIEALDHELIRPAVQRLDKFPDHRILVLSTVGVLGEQSQLVTEAAPFAVAGSDLDGVRGYPFRESAARASDLKPKDAAELFEFFLGMKSPIFEAYRKLLPTEWRVGEASAE
ncbi:MAG: hypothetical protein RL885_20285 [Planctomycetota bacterium]